MLRVCGGGAAGVWDGCWAPGKRELHWGVERGAGALRSRADRRAGLLGGKGVHPSEIRLEA